MNIKEGFGILFFILGSVYLIHRFFKYQENNEYEKLLKGSERKFDEARADFEEQHKNLFPDSYDRTDEIINGDGHDNDDEQS